MNIAPIVDILQGSTVVNNEVIVRGWVRSRRDSKIGISFLTVYDGSCFDSLQIIVNNSIPNYNTDILRLTAGCSIIVIGKIVISTGRDQHFEVLASSIKVEGWVENPHTYPMSAKNHSVEHLRQEAHLRPRTNLIGAIVRVRHTVAQALHNFFSKQGYLWISTPIITASDTEGASEMFRVSTLDMENLPRTSDGKIDFSKDFFGKESFLTVSGQLNAEAYACALSKIYTFGPTFRAENSNTSRHLAEFWMLEPEVAFASLDDIIILAEDMLKYVIKIVLEKCINDMKFLERRTENHIIARLERFVSTDFIQIDYTDAVTILQNCGKKFKDQVCWGADLSSEHERHLTEEYFKSPIIVKNYPKDVKAFYMRLNEDGKTVAAMDVIVPEIGEIVGGSQREERLKVLDVRMKEMGVKKENYWWYRDLRRYGTVPHSGFGLGFDRLITYVTGIHNIRDVIPFPRTPRSLSF